jgi:hypothetical protein
MREVWRYVCRSSARAAATSGGNKDTSSFFNGLSDEAGCDCAAAGCAIGVVRHTHCQGDRCRRQRRHRAPSAADCETATGGARRDRELTAGQRRGRDRRNATSDRNRGAARDAMAAARSQTRASRIHAKKTAAAAAALRETETTSTAAARRQSTAATFPSRPAADSLEAKSARKTHTQKDEDGVRETDDDSSGNTLWCR